MVVKGNYLRLSGLLSLVLRDSVVIRRRGNVMISWRGDKN